MGTMVRGFMWVLERSIIGSGGNCSNFASRNWRILTVAREFRTEEGDIFEKWKLRQNGDSEDGVRESQLILLHARIAGGGDKDSLQARDQSSFGMVHIKSGK